jgi:hypothetical protein
VVRGTKVVGKSHARALRRCFPAPHPFDLKVPEAGSGEVDGLPRFLLDFGLKPFLGGVLRCAFPVAHSRVVGHFFRKNEGWSLYFFRPPSHFRLQKTAMLSANNCHCQGLSACREVNKEIYHLFLVSLSYIVTINDNKGKLHRVHWHASSLELDATHE